MTIGRGLTRTLSIALAGLVGVSALAIAQGPARTAWGDPDLQRVWAT